MRTLFGMIVGCVLTIGVVYIHDSLVISTGTIGSSSRAIVNWDAAGSAWGQVEEGVRTGWLKLKTMSNG